MKRKKIIAGFVALLVLSGCSQESATTLLCSGGDKYSGKDRLDVTVTFDTDNNTFTQYKVENKALGATRILDQKMNLNVQDAFISFHAKSKLNNGKYHVALLMVNRSSLSFSLNGSQQNASTNNAVKGQTLMVEGYCRKLEAI